MVNKQKLEELEGIIQKSSDLRTSALTRKETYEGDIKRIEEEFVSLGTTAEKAPEKIQELDLAMEKTVKEIEANLPIELLKKFKMI